MVRLESRIPAGNVIPIPSTSSETRRWLTEEAKARAVDVLKQRRKDAHKKWHDVAEDHEKLWKIAGCEKGESWETLKQRIERCWNGGSRTWQSANDLAAHLLDRPPGAITTDRPPARPRPIVATRTMGLVVLADHSLTVSHPKRIADHRAVILGQLPRPGLFPAVFIDPDDGYWYPQCGVHNPLVADCAFVCLAHFGKPNGVKRAPPTLSAKVRVYALSASWSGGSTRVRREALDAAVTPLDPVTHVTFVVERCRSAVDSISLSHGNRPLSVPRAGTIACSAPLKIRWRGRGDALLQIHDGTTYAEHFNKLVPSPITLTLGDERRSQRGWVVQLPKPGLYRVRVYPLKFSFLDPPHEWWLNLEPTHGGGRNRR